MQKSAIFSQNDTFNHFPVIDPFHRYRDESDVKFPNLESWNRKQEIQIQMKKNYRDTHTVKLPENSYDPSELFVQIYKV